MAKRKIDTCLYSDMFRRQAELVYQCFWYQHHVLPGCDISHNGMPYAENWSPTTAGECARCKCWKPKKNKKKRKAQ